MVTNRKKLFGIRKNEKDLLDVAENHALEHYEEFDKRLRQEEKQIAEAEDIALFEALKEKAKHLEVQNQIEPK